MACAETHWMWLFQHKCAFLLKKIPVSTLGTMALVVHNLIVSKPQENKHTLRFAKEDLPLSFSCGPGFMSQETSPWRMVPFRALDQGGA